MLDHWPAPVRQSLFKVVGVHWADRLLTRAWQSGDGDLHGMLDYLFRRNGFRIRVDGADRLDALGACIVAGNHPHGLFDGLALAWLSSRGGQPTRVIARHFLNVFAPLRRVFLAVRLDGQRRSTSGRASFEAARDWLAGGGRLVMTPAGGLSRATPFWSRARDPAWRTGVVRLAQATGRPVVLVAVEMPASPVRQLLHRLHPIARALAQVWAYRLGKRQTIRLRVVEVIHPSDWPTGTSLHDRAAWLQQRLEAKRRPDQEG